MRVVHAICALVLALGCQGVAAQTVARDPVLPPDPPPLIDHPSKRPAQGDVLLLVRQQQDDGFRPVSELPPEEQLPAAPMLVGAYAFVVLALFAYVLSLSRRLRAVANDIVTLEKQVKRSERS